MLMAHELHGENGKFRARHTVSPAPMGRLIISVVFALETVLMVIGLTDLFPVVAVTIVALSILIIVMAEHMSLFSGCNRVCEVLGLFMLLLVGIVLTNKGRHPVLSGREIDFMSRALFYYVLFLAMPLDVVSRRCQCKMMAQVAARSASHLAATR